jgi:hypothetical protein
MKINKSQISLFFNNIIKQPNSCAEVRIFSAEVDRSNRIVRSRHQTCVAGWFTREDELICELSRIDNCSCYITVNPVSLERRPLHAKNNLKILRRGEFTTDQDILCIRYLIIDIDPPSKGSQRSINSTNNELFDCITLGEKIISGLEIQDYCFSGISGNGAFILISLPDYDNTKELSTEIMTFVEHINSEYSDNTCKIDINTRNPSRLLAIPGTTKHRDLVHSQERPHRMVEIRLGQPHDTSTTIRPQGMA